MALRPRVRLEAESRRSQLIELGLTLLSVTPVEQVPVDEIIRAAGISRSLLFHYFPSKRDFHVAVVRAAAAHLLEVTSGDPDLPPLERLKSGLHAFADYVSSNRDLYMALVRGSGGADPELQGVVSRSRVTFADRLLSIVGDADVSPIMRSAARGWFGFVEESTLDWAEQRDYDVGELVDFQVAVVLREMQAFGISPPVR